MTSPPSCPSSGARPPQRHPAPAAWRELLPGLALLAVALVWGSTFFMTKDLITRVPPLDYLAVRFVVAGVVGALVFARRLARADAATWRAGLVLGAVYAVAQLAQTYGLSIASASVSGFLTALYVVGTPLVAWLLWRVRVARATGLAVALALAGAAVLGLSGLHVGTGELALLGCATVYSVHVALLSRWSVGRDALALGAIQMISLGAVHTLVALPDGIVAPQGRDWAVMLYLAVAAGLGALVVQSWAQARMDAARAAVIMAMEPVFSASFAVALGGEHLTWRLGVGGSLILAATLLAELAPLVARGRILRSLGAGPEEDRR